MQIVFTLNAFRALTGSEIYVYELAKELTKKGHKTYIVAGVISFKMMQMANEAGIEVSDAMNFPNINPDIVHINQREMINVSLLRYPNATAIYTIHSLYADDRPILSSRIHKYICIRENLVEAAKAYGVPEDKIILLYNGFDTERFKPMQTNNEKKICLFAGTANTIRKKALLDVIERGQKEDFDVLFVGADVDGYLNSITAENFFMNRETDKIEEYLAKVDMTAGIFMGRTTIEGWLCGKPGYIYDVDMHNGNIKGVEFVEPPRDLEKFDIKNITNKLLVIYEEIRKKQT